MTFVCLFAYGERCFAQDTRFFNHQTQTVECVFSGVETGLMNPATLGGGIQQRMLRKARDVSGVKAEPERLRCGHMAVEILLNFSVLQAVGGLRLR